METKEKQCRPDGIIDIVAPLKLKTSKSNRNLETEMYKETFELLEAMEQFCKNGMRLRVCIIWECEG